MHVIGTIESAWRYPVKGMRGESLQSAFVGFAGVFGDRIYAIHSKGSQKGFPYLTPREQGPMLQYQPVFRDPAQMTAPPNLAEADALGPGITPVYPELSSCAVDVRLPSGELLPIDDPALLEKLQQGLGDRHELSLMRSERALTDCRPISLFSLQTVAQLGEEVGVPLDKHRFRANFYVTLASETGFGENELLGKTLRIGAKATVAVVDPIPRCKMITLDPGTSEANPNIIKKVKHSHDGNAGIYCAVIVEGVVRPGDEIAVLN